MLSSVRNVLVIAAISVLAACGTDGEGDQVPDECNPLGGTTCLMPWPSSAYLTEANTTTGFQIDLPIEAMPVNVDGTAIDPAYLNRYDGFGPSGVIFAAFPSGVSADGLPGHSDPMASKAPDSSVILLNMETEQRVAFFAEIDMNTSRPEKRTLIIHPLERMQPGARHLVAIRKSVTGPNGEPLEISPAFQAMVDGKSYDHPLMDRLAPTYPEIFAKLEGQGVSKDDLVLAWDFVTASDEFLTSDLLAMRSQSEGFIGTNGENLTFRVEDTHSANPSRVHSFFSGTYDAPNFLTDGESDLSIIKRGSDGLPELDGTYNANFGAIIPACVTSAQLPLPVVILGHGLFGDGLDFLDSGFLQDVANQNCVVMVAGDFIGLTGRQFAAAAFAVNNVNRATGLTEKLAQSVMNFTALEQLIQGPFARAPEFQYEGTPIIDTTRVNYFGASLGGIMGNVFMAYNKNIKRGVLGVPGGSWSLLFERSFAWSALQGAAIGAYEDQHIYQLLTGIMGLYFEPYDPITTAGRVINDPLPDTPSKQIFIYEAINDSLVTNLATEMVAREMGLDVCGPSIKLPFGMTEQLQPMSSAFSIYDEKILPLNPSTNVPPATDNGTHGDINEYPAVLRQWRDFFNNGQITNQCKSGDVPVICDCSAGNCE